MLLLLWLCFCGFVVVAVLLHLLLPRGARAPMCRWGTGVRWRPGASLHFGVVVATGHQCTYVPLGSHALSGALGLTGSIETRAGGWGQPFPAGVFGGFGPSAKLLLYSVSL